MLLGFSTWAMPELPIDIAVSHLKSLGFDAIEIGVLPRFSTALDKMDRSERIRIDRLLRDYDIKLSAVSAYLDMMTQDDEQCVQNIDYVKRAIDLAEAWSEQSVRPTVITGFGGSPGDLETQRDLLIERLNQLGGYAEARGVMVALEHHVGAALEMPEQVVAVMEQIESPAIRVNFDISHFNVMGIPIEESVEKMVGYAVHAHIKDESGRAPDHEYLVPGEGEFDYVRYLNAMQAHGYNGVISTEISVMVQQRSDYDPLVTASRSYEVVSKAFAEAGLR